MNEEDLLGYSVKFAGMVIRHVRLATSKNGCYSLIIFNQTPASEQFLRHFRLKKPADIDVLNFGNGR